MLTGALAAVSTLANTVISRAFPDKDEAQRFQAEFTRELLNLSQTELNAAMQVVVAEAQGESWLQRNWRPLMMVWFGVLVGVYWFGFTPENLSEDSIESLFLLVQVGLGGYVVGRSGEKIAKVMSAKGRL